MTDPVAELIHWLAGAAARGAAIEEVIRHCGLALDAAGTRIMRASVSTTTVHPQMNAFRIAWRRGLGTERAELDHGGERREAWLTSPLRAMLQESRPRARQRLDDPEARRRFPVFDELYQEGLTDWYACSEVFGWLAPYLPLGELGMVASWSTDKPGGFSDDDLAVLDRLSLPLAAAVKSRVVEDLTRAVLEAYVGRGPAEQVLSGAITRGAVTESPAVLMLADIRHFTRRGETQSTRALVGLLNATFDATAGPIAAAGGQILKFLGDGFLAVFLTAERAEDAAVEAAIDAALTIQRRLPEGVELDIAIHIGDVHYGNVGAADRLDFTVIGSAVNEVARMEGLCRELGQPILVSAAAAERVDGRGLVFLGQHRLRGFDEPRRLFAPE